jgi:hypothetical protein
VTVRSRWLLPALELRRLAASRFHSYAARRCAGLVNGHAVTQST